MAGLENGLHLEQEDSSERDFDQLVMRRIYKLA